jgi:hypothetical protein
MSRDVGLPAAALRDTGLAFTNKSGRLQDSFRGRVMFPIMSENGDRSRSAAASFPAPRSGQVQEFGGDVYLCEVEDSVWLHAAKGDIVRRIR